VETATAIPCPLCAFENNDGGDTCARCGVVLAKARVGVPSMRSIPTVVDARRDAGAWKLLAGGLIAALIAHAIPFVEFILSPLVTLLHESGHAATAWLLGCPAVPAFDFTYGGGITEHHDFQLPLGLLIGAGWAWLLWTFRRNPRSLAVIGLCAGAWLLAVSSEWRRELVIASMGHLGEVILASVLLAMALTGIGWRIPEIERPLGAFAAFFVQMQTLRFAWRLRHDAAFLAEYGEGKGGAMMNDLEVIALDVKIWTGVSMDVREVAGWLMLFALVLPAAAVLLYVYRQRVHEFARSLLVLER
jgi:hypothetical protein